MNRLLVLVLLVVAACGGGADAPPARGGGTVTALGPASAQTATVQGRDDDTYDPATVHAAVGTLTLTLRNAGVPHDLAFQDRRLPSIPVVGGGEQRATTLTFARPGTYVFECTIHPGMTGEVVVG